MIGFLLCSKFIGGLIKILSKWRTKRVARSIYVKRQKLLGSFDYDKLVTLCVKASIVVLIERDKISFSFKWLSKFNFQSQKAFLNPIIIYRLPTFHRKASTKDFNQKARECMECYLSRFSILFRFVENFSNSFVWSQKPQGNKNFLKAQIDFLAALRIFKLLLKWSNEVKCPRIKK